MPVQFERGRPVRVIGSLLTEVCALLQQDRQGELFRRPLQDDRCVCWIARGSVDCARSRWCDFATVAVPSSRALRDRGVFCAAVEFAPTDFAHTWRESSGQMSYARPGAKQRPSRRADESRRGPPAGADDCSGTIEHALMRAACGTVWRWCCCRRLIHWIDWETGYAWS